MSKINLFIPEKARSHRQLKVAEELRHILSTLFVYGDFPPLCENGEIIYQIKEPITITHFNISPDLKQATAFIMPLQGHDVENIKNYFENMKGYFRHQVSKQIKLRYTPKIDFKIDETFSKAEKIDSIFDKIQSTL